MESVSLFRRAKKVYYAKYFEDGRWKKKSLHTSKRSEAIRRIESLTSTINPSRQRITIGEFRRRFLDHAQHNISAVSVKRYRQAITRFCDHIGNDARLLESISVRECDEFVSLRLQVIRPTTVNNEIRHLKAFLNRGVRWEFIGKNPFDKVRPLKIPESHPVYLSKEEFGLLFRTIEEPWLQLAVVLSCTLGLRSGEAIALRWEDIDTVNKTLHVKNTATFVTKSRKNRVVPIPPNVVPFLVEARKRAESASVLHAPNRQIDSYLLSHAFKAYVRRLGLNPQLHYHSCRHTAATWWVADGIPLNVCQRWLGHSSISVVMVYAHSMTMRYEEYASRLTLPSLN